MAWNKPTGGRGKREEGRGGLRNAHLKGLVVGVIVVLGAGLAAWLLTNGEAASSSLQKKDRGLIKEVRAAKVSKPIEKSAAKLTGEVVKADLVSTNSVSTNAVAKKLPSHCISSFARRPGAKPPLFTDAVTIQLQEYVVAARDVPPPSRVSDQEALNACISGVTMLETDTPEDRAIKESVAGLLKELKQWLRDGRHANDFFNELQNRQEREYETRETVRSEIMKVARDGNAEETKEAMKAYNKFLREKGLPEVRILPLHHLQREINEEESTDKKEGETK